MSETLPATAIDTALIKGNRGCQFLEIQRPTKQDLKTAAEAFKDASDILKASQVLLDHDCYLVQDPPEPAATPHDSKCSRSAESLVWLRYTRRVAQSYARIFFRNCVAT